MNFRKLFLFITVVCPGLLVVGTSSYWFYRDYNALMQAETYLEKQGKAQKVVNNNLEFAYHRALSHRINVFADGTWGLLGGVITAIGIYGLVTLEEKDEKR